jgi:endonuclease/exonuclease/phosphatase family metal-dependent hydrolase
MISQKLRVLVLAVLVPLAALVAVPVGCTPVKPVAPSDGRTEGPYRSESGRYLFCFWNVENLFDDIDNNRQGPGDREFDPWFANNPDILRLKLSRLTEALIKVNDGKGPDILGLAEVESVRAAELLRDALNKRLKNESLHYTNILMKELTAGRHIAPAIITRLPVRRDRTRLLGKHLRILEGHLVVDGKELIVIASHWTSRVRKDTAKQRAKHGDQIYGTFRGMYKRNPKVDLLVCGDFNDTPNDESVTEHLHATGDREAVLNAENNPLLYNLFAGKDPKEFGTHYDRGRWYIFDQIVVSPGLLDDTGWTCDPGSVRTVNTLVRPRDRQRRPWRFGSKRDQGQRGYSDHFPVTVRLKVQ